MSECIAELTMPNLYDPPEFCDEPTVEGEDYCRYHLDDHDE